MPLHRRQFLATSAAAALLPAATRAQDDSFEVTRSEEEWRAMLTDLQYEVMREEGTEPAFSSPLHDSKAKGIYHCRGCDLAVYSSEHKYDSGTGWPSFWQPIRSGAVGTSTDYKIGVPRTEVHCARCGGHLGHVFDDGPRPTGKRYCMNGVALSFQPA